MSSESDWQATREAFLNRILNWIDTAGESEQGQQQLAMMLTHLDGVAQEAVTASVRGLDEITQDLTALRHELKINTKQARSFAEVLTRDVQRIVESSDNLLEHVSQQADAQPNNHAQPNIDDQMASDVARPAVTAMIEVDEALSRLSQAYQSALTDCPAPPAQRPGGWLGRRKLELQDQLWQAAWQSRKQSLDGLAEGLRLTTQRISQQLAALNVQRIGVAGDPFDPHTMQVLEVEASPQHPVGTVLRVLRTGYRQEAWLIRPAQVVTAAP